MDLRGQRVFNVRYRLDQDVDEQTEFGVYRCSAVLKINNKSNNQVSPKVGQVRFRVERLD